MRREGKYFQDIQGVGSQETTVVKLHSTKNEQEGGRRASLAKRRKQKKSNKIHHFRQKV